jgi:7,8-dihydro-6-hydroxymethylpterin-pyrophosphokinase
MVAEVHSGLIHISVDLVGGQEKSKLILSKISELSEITEISSIYKRYLNKDRVDFNARMEFVIRFETVMSVEQTLYMLLSLREHHAAQDMRRNHVELILLVFDQKTLMSPKLTLPYPDLHKDSLIVRCAAEAWGSYEHPVYLKTLTEIAKAAPPVRDAEFHLQGKSLVDF